MLTLLASDRALEALDAFLGFGDSAGFEGWDFGGSTNLGFGVWTGFETGVSVGFETGLDTG